ARALSLNTTQEQSLQLVFQWADTRGLELVDLADLRAVITHLTSPEGKPELATIGGVSSATAGVILRALTTLEAQGGDQFFGEPAFDTADLLRQVDGKGVVSLLGVGDMAQRPALVSTVIMWLLADLFSGLPEVGDPERPKLVFFFDEAHLLFADATKEFQRQVVQTVRLIRSKGVGIVFVTQTPKDIPADVLAQLGSRVQHALRAVTPEDQKKLRQTVDTFPRTELELDEVLTTLGTGEAVVTVLAPDGRPTPVAPTRVWAPASVMGPAQAGSVAALVAGSSLAAKYATAVNPDSAEEKLARQAQEAEEAKIRAAQAAAEQAAAEKQAKADAATAAKAEKARQAEADRAARAAEKQREKDEAAARRAAERRTGAFEKALGNAVRSAGTQLGREITRSIFGTRKR
ncbi:MAG: helicase HerA-like domain-containing protein, partial [Pauljensenia sp.]